jgi:hypothetical protein
MGQIERASTPITTMTKLQQQQETKAQSSVKVSRVAIESFAVCINDIAFFLVLLLVHVTSLPSSHITPHQRTRTISTYVQRTNQLPITLVYHTSHIHTACIMTTTDKYSILLPTYNERENLPIITWLIDTELSKAYGPIHTHTHTHTHTQ